MYIILNVEIDGKEVMPMGYGKGRVVHNGFSPDRFWCYLTQSCHY